jgi:small GTP-binding protein
MLTTQPKNKYTLVPIKEAQEVAGVVSHADDAPPPPPHGYGSAHRRSMSLGAGMAAPLAAGLGPSPFAKKSPPAEKKNRSPPPARPQQQRSAQTQAPQQHSVENFVGGEEWDTESILSDSCRFDWDLLSSLNTEPKLQAIKCLVIGDAGVGKTTLCKTMLGDSFDPDYHPTVFETYKIRVPLFKEMPVEIWDMSGNAKYDKKRPVVYPNVNGILICFDLTSKESWRNVKRKWVPEAMSYPDFPLLIAGCKFDCINAANAQMCIQPAQGDSIVFASFFSDTFSAVNSFLDKQCRGVFKSAHFVSTSALKGIGLEQLFAAIVYTAMYLKKRPDEINSGIARIKHMDFINK